MISFKAFIAESRKHAAYDQGYRTALSGLPAHKNPEQDYGDDADEYIKGYAAGKHAAGKSRLNRAKAYWSPNALPLHDLLAHGSISPTYVSR